MKQFFLILALLLPFCLFGQFDESFSGGDLSSYPVWKGNLNLYKVNANGQLQLNDAAFLGAGQASVYTTIPFTPEMQWELDVMLGFNPSNANHMRVYLYSAADLASASFSDYYLQIGSNNDDVTLRKTAGAEPASTVLIQGIRKRLDKDQVSLRIRLTLTSAGRWTLYTRLSGEPAFVTEGSCQSNLNGLKEEGYFKINCCYSKTRGTHFRVDNIHIRSEINSDPDTPVEEPVVTPQVDVESTTTLLLTFDKPVAIDEAVIGITDLGEADEYYISDDGYIVKLVFAQAMQLLKSYTLTWTDLFDLEGNRFKNGAVIFTCSPGDTTDPEEPETPDTPSPVKPAQLIFNEILFDPFTGGSEYIELYNRSSEPLDVSGLFIALRKQDGTLSTHYPLYAVTTHVEPETCFALTKSISGVTSFYTVTASALIYEQKLPVLANAGATIVLVNTLSGEVIDELTYTPKWHASSLKSTKGVALERLDTEADTQDEANWTSASSQAGSGTPGYANSQHSTPPEEGEDGTDPELPEEGVDTPVRDGDSYTISYRLNKPGYNCKAVIFDAMGRMLARVPVNGPLATEGKITWNTRSLNSGSLATGIYIFYAEFFHPDGNLKRYKKAFPVRW